MATCNFSSAISALTLIPTAEPKSVHPPTVIMQDDSMSPTFVKGDELTIDYEVDWNPGYFMLVRSGHMLLVRRLTDRGDNESHMDFMPDNPTYPSVLDDGSDDPWGVVTAVRRVDGTSETFDLAKLVKWADESKESEEEAVEAVCA
jgi:hypothetical protein